jgi:hypothetical protein
MAMTSSILPAVNPLYRRPVVEQATGNQEQQFIEIFRKAYSQSP